MQTNYLTTAWTQISRHRFFSLINIAGLAISLTAVFYIALYVEDEVSYDRFHEKAARIYRVADNKKTPDLLLRSAASAVPVAPALKNDFPEVQQTARILPTSSLIALEDKSFQERNIYFADNSLFDIFSFVMVHGDPKTSLASINSIVMTETMALKYFNTANAVGKILNVDKVRMTVTGVIKDVPP